MHVKQYTFSDNDDDEEWTYALSKMYTLFDTLKACNSVLNLETIEKDIISNKIQYIFLLFPSASSSKCIGFALCEIKLEQEGDHLHINYICTKAVKSEARGQKLVHEIETFAAQQGIDTITVDALTPVIGYYRKRGYRHIKSCSEQHENTEISKTGDKLKNVRLQRKSRKSPRIRMRTQKSHKKQEHDEQSLHNFLILLTKNGYSIQCPTFSDTEDEEDFKTHECEVNGFRMMKCLPKQKNTHSSPTTPVQKSSGFQRHSKKPIKHIPPTTLLQLDEDELAQAWWLK